MVRFWWQSYRSVDPEGVRHLGSTEVARLQRGGKGGRHNNVTQLQYVAIMQLLDTQDTLHYSIRGPASGNTSLPDVDSSRFAGCTSGARTGQSLWGLLGALASAAPPSRFPPPSFSFSRPLPPFQRRL